MPIRKDKLRRMCKRCFLMFKPSGDHCHICNKCNKSQMRKK